MMWLFVHPEVADAVAALLHATLTISGLPRTLTELVALVDRKQELVGLQLCLVLISEETSLLTLDCLRCQVRFRLRGPRSTAVLRHVLRCAPTGGSPVQHVAEQLWARVGGVSSPAVLSSRSVLALTVLDPRLVAPKPGLGADRGLLIKSVLDCSCLHCNRPNQCRPAVRELGGGSLAVSCKNCKQNDVRAGACALARRGCLLGHLGRISPPSCLHQQAST
jgi:hypothetical protein